MEGEEERNMGKRAKKKKKKRGRGIKKEKKDVKTRDNQAKKQQ